jgi:hypothetical protein
VGLKVARALRDQACREVTAGRKPRGMREQERIDAAMAVEAMTWGWFEEQKDRWSEHFRKEVRAPDAERHQQDRRAPRRAIGRYQRC